MKAILQIKVTRFRTLLLLSSLLCLFAMPLHAKTIKIATVSPDGSSWMRAMRSASKEIEKQTDGRIKFKFYPGGVMGSDKAVMRKIRVGQLQGGAFPGGALMKVAPDSQIYNLPLKFHSFDEIDYVRQRLDQHIIDDFEKGGFISFGLAEGGMAYMMTNNPVRSVADLREQKVWVPNDDPASLNAVETFGITPIPLGIADVLASLQTGLVNTVSTSPIGAIALQWHTQVKYMTDLPLLYFYATLAIDKKVFNKLSAEDQKIVRDIMTATFKEIDKQNRKDNEAAFAALKKQGIEVITPSEEQLQEWRSLARKAEQTYLTKGHISKQIADQLEQLLKAYRSQQASLHAD